MNVCSAYVSRNTCTSIFDSLSKSFSVRYVFHLVQYVLFFFFLFFGRRWLKKRSEKTEIARPKKRKRRKRGKAGERTSGSARIKRSPLPPRHETYTRSPRTLFLIFHFRLLIKNVNFE